MSLRTLPRLLLGVRLEIPPRKHMLGRALRNLAEDVSMRHTRIIVTRYGGPDALQVIEEERPEPKQGEVRVRVLAAGVSLPDVMMREGIHPETPPVPFTPGWDLVGVVDRLGTGVYGLEPGELIAALPISGAYAEFVCLPQRELVPVPAGLDPAEAVSLVLNYVTAYQMLHRSANVKPGQRVLIHGASGGVGTALLQLGHLAVLEMYGTCSSRGASVVSRLGAVPIDYQQLDFVEEIQRLTGAGVDVVFESLGGSHIWRSRKALRSGERSSPMVSLRRCAAVDRHRVAKGVVIASVRLLRSAGTSRRVGSLPAGSESPPTASNGSSAGSRRCFARI